MILNLDDNIAKFKSLSFSYAREDEPAQKQDSVCPVGSPEEDYEIDKIIEKKLKKSQ